MATTDNLVKLGQLQTALTRVKTEIDNLDGKTFSSVDVSNGKINFYATTDHTGTALESIDLPEEIFLDQTQTTFIQSFAWSNVAYPGSTNPSLEGKPVLVLAVKGDKTTNPTQTYSFINLEKLVDTYTASNSGINISGYSIGLNLSTIAGNFATIDNSGLYVGAGGGKVDKVTSAVAGNIVTFGASGAIIDSGYTIAGDSDINAMITGIFGTVSGGAGA